MEQAVAQTIARAQHIRVLVDLACGDALLGVHLSRLANAELIGIDSAIATISASKNAHLSRNSRALVAADFSALPLNGRSVQCVVSLDGLYLAPHPLRALQEIRRILSITGSLIFTVYTADGPVPGGAVLRSDWQQLLYEAGFSRVHAANVTEEWRRIMSKKHAARLLRAETLTRRFGARADAELAVSAAMLGVFGPAFLNLVRRWEITADGQFRK